MVRRKVCMLGAYAVGKTSLVSRFVYRMFNEKYHSTVGVRIDKASVPVGEQQVDLMLWDLEGDDELAPLRQSYLRGAAGYVLVGDGTRPATLDALLVIQRTAAQVLGDVPFITVLNKGDLKGQWTIDPTLVAKLQQEDGWTIVTTSARTGEGVEEMFQTLAARLIGPDHHA